MAENRSASVVRRPRPRKNLVRIPGTSADNDDIPALLHQLARTPTSDTDASDGGDLSVEDISSDGWGSPQPAESSWFELGRNLFRIAPFLDQAEEDRFADWYDEKVRNFWTLSCFSVSLFIGLAYRVDHTVHLMTCLCLSMVGLLEFIEGRIKQGEPAPSWW